VDTREQHVGASPENVRGSVAVVHIPVKDQDLADAELPGRQLGRDRDVVDRQKPIARSRSA
jgi:hypothetical protein